MNKKAASGIRTILGIILGAIITIIILVFFIGFIAIILPIILILLLIAILTGKLRIMRIKKQPAPQEKQPKKRIKEERIIDAEYKMK